MLNTFFPAVLLTLLLYVSTGHGNSQPYPYPQRQPCTQYIVHPQYNPSSGSYFSNVPSVVIFTNTVIKAIYNSDLLREAFDISQTTALEYAQWIYKYNVDMLTSQGFKNSIPLAEFAYRGITQNFDVIRMPLYSRFKANLAANYLFVQGVLTTENAERLALTYIEYVKRYAQESMTDDPTSKIYVCTQSFIDFIRSCDVKAMSNFPVLVFFYGNEWWVAASNYKHFNQL